MKLEPVVTTEARAHHVAPVTPTRPAKQGMPWLRHVERPCRSVRLMIIAIPSIEDPIASTKNRRWKVAHSTGPVSASASAPQATAPIPQPIDNAMSASAPRIRIQCVMPGVYA